MVPNSALQKVVPSKVVMLNSPLSEAWKGLRYVYHRPLTVCSEIYLQAVNEVDITAYPLHPVQQCIDGLLKHPATAFIGTPGYVHC
jgi:hypothetical protein